MLGRKYLCIEHALIFIETFFSPSALDLSGCSSTSVWKVGVINGKCKWPSAWSLLGSNNWLSRDIVWLSSDASAAIDFGPLSAGMRNIPKMLRLGR